LLESFIIPDASWSKARMILNSSKSVIVVWIPRQICPHFPWCAVMCWWRPWDGHILCAKRTSKIPELNHGFRS